MARGAVIQKIKPLHPELKPPPGAVPYGRTADGKHQLYRMVTTRSRGVPRILNTPEAKAREEALKAEGKTPEQIRAALVEEGFQAFRKNQTTGENAYPLNKPELYEYEEVFYLESDGHGNIYKQPYALPTPEQLAAERRRLQVEALGGGKLAELMVDEGLSAEDLIATVKQRQAAGNGNGAEPVSAPAPATPATASAPPENSYPRKLGGPWWQLSSGEKVRGSKEEALKQEESLPEEVRQAAAEAQADAEAVPTI